MSKSFSLRLSDYNLGYPIGGAEKVLERGADVTDVISFLMDEGFTEFSETRVYHKMHGRDLASLQSRIETGVVGIPRTAYVNISAYGPESDYLVIFFEY